jgi:hypothetical protein
MIGNRLLILQLPSVRNEGKPSAEKKAISPLFLQGEAVFRGIPSLKKDFLYYGMEHEKNFFWAILDTKKMEITKYRSLSVKDSACIRKDTAWPLACALDSRYFYAGRDSVYLVDCQTLEIVKKSKPIERVFWGGLTPSGKLLYILSSLDGLFILDPISLEVRAHYRFGRCINAYSMGVTFGAYGKVACVTTPYEGRLTLLEADTYTAIAHIQIEPACGAFLIPGNKEWQCLVLPVKLPYE